MALHPPVPEPFDALAVRLTLEPLPDVGGAGYLYAMDCDNGLQVFDLSDPISPQIVGSVDMACGEIAIEGSYA